jgi:membrane AbrB-like protein
MIVSQIAIGISLGCRFEQELILRLPRVALGALVTTVYLIIATAGGAWILSSMTGLPYSVSFLSIAPAAVTEMTLTAQSMNIDAEIVTAFHVMRISVIEVSILVAYATFRRIATRRTLL